MRYQVNCLKCNECIRWDNACDHIKAGDYEILPDEDEELPEDYTRDHGDSVWPK